MGKDNETSFPESGDDDLTAKLRDEFEKIGDDEGDLDDDGGFDAPLDDAAIETRDAVDEEEGVKRIQEARDRGSKPTPPTKPKDKAEASDDEQKAKDPDATEEAAKDLDKPNDDDAQKDGDEDKAKEPLAELTDDAYAEAIGKLPENVQTKLNAERTAYQDILAPFKGREAELERLGTTPKDAINRLVQINDYAQRDPAGYLAWVVNQTTGGNADQAKAVLEKAANTMGYKIAENSPGADDDEDDPFISDRERELMDEVKALKASQQSQATEFGPDTPEERARQDVISVISETDTTGNLVRPHFETLQPIITSIVQAELQRTGVPVTREGLISAYEQAELAHPATKEAAIERLVAAKIAAQTNSDVRKEVQRDAAATAKAKAASNKIIDGPGQGAQHQPANEDADMGLEDFLRKQMSGT